MAMAEEVKKKRKPRNEINLRAFGKVNLGLDVIRKREDGFHDLDMIMQTVGIFDRINIKISDEPGVRLTTNAGFLPVDDNNLIVKAAKFIIDEYDIKKGVDIYLGKKLPVAAGMAGGSSDCAAVLVGMNKLFNLRIPMKKLMVIGERFGSDVPYCLMRGTARAQGKGEALTSLKAAPDCHVVITRMAFGVSTKFVYENLVLDDSIVHPDIEGMVDAIEKGDLKGVTDRMGNVLESVTIKKYPQIEEVKNIMRDNGALNAMMSGSGPTVFGIFDDKEKAQQAVLVLKDNASVKRCYLTYFFNNTERKDKKDGATTN